jgi:phage recombination protein Bet
MNALVKMEIPALQMAEEELLAVMQNSVYPGAKLESIKLVLGYCRSQHLDPMTKPVHIVPMDVKTDKKKPNGDPIYEKRDVIMPGIELYRTKAARTGEYAGCSEPEWGPMITMKFVAEVWTDSEEGGGRSKKNTEGSIQHPEWCRVTARRIVDGRIVEFTAIEYWIENYATASKYSSAPGPMWKKRPRGQLAKCTEAQALRKGFPEVGALPTAEEMEGKTLDLRGDVIDATPAAIEGPQSKSVPPAAKAPIEGESKREADPAAAAEGESEEGNKPDPANDKPIMEQQLKILRAKMARAALSDADLIAKFGPIEALKFGQFDAIQNWVNERAAKLG